MEVTVHLKRQPRRYRGITACFGQNIDNVVAAGRFPIHEVPYFFSPIFILSQMRLKFTSLSLLDSQKMPKLIPHYSNFKSLNFLRNLPVSDFLISLFWFQISFLAQIHWDWVRAIFFYLTTCSRDVWLAIRIKNNFISIREFRFGTFCFCIEYHVYDSLVLWCIEK